MSKMFRYESTPEERAAARLLKRKGWSVREPSCPDCHGFGIVGKIDESGSGKTKSVTYNSIRCPRGCAFPMMVL